MGGMSNRQAAREQRVSTCKVCRYGVFFGEPAVWARGLLMGIAHARCADGSPFDTRAVDGRRYYYAEDAHSSRLQGSSL